MSNPRSPSLLTSRGFVPTPADKAQRASQQKDYVRDLWILIACVVAFLTVVRFARLLASSLSKPRAPEHIVSLSEKKPLPEDAQPGATGKISWRRIHVALASAFRIISFRLVIPIGPNSKASIAELLFILGYISATFVWLLIDTHDFTAWFFRDRAAHLASCQLPLIVALAGKNNIISFLTGIGHEKLNVLHRAASRTCLILLWVHAGARVVGGLSPQSDLSHDYMRWGAVSLAAFTIATFVSIRPIRNAFFEFFLVSHIVLVGIALLGGYLHARDPGYGDYIWPSLVIWALDRVLRLGRILWNNRIGITNDKHHSTASVELLSEDTIRLTLRRRLKWKPGQHAYVTLPTISDLPTEAHPFTMANTPGSLDGTDGPEEKDVVFIIRGRNGFTGRLREYATANAGAAVPALIDGPYGCPPNLTRYSTCILIAGGSGVSYTLSLLLGIVHDARANRSAIRRVVFVWSVKDPEHLKWISKLLIEALASSRFSSLVIEPRLYITGPVYPIPDIPTIEDAELSASTPTTTENSVEKAGGPPLYSALTITHGRPSIPRILRDEIHLASGPVSVDVAGPPTLSQSVRRALSRGPSSPLGVLKGAPSVTLHVETFGMAN